MTQDEIIEMAREAGGSNVGGHGWTTWVGTQSTEFLERFAKLVAAKVIAELESQEPVEPTEKIYKAWEILVGQHKDLLEENKKLRNQLQRTWVGLTDEDLKLLSAEWRIVYGAWMDDFAKDIEAKLKEKNT